MINGRFVASINGSMVIINAKPPLKEIVAASDTYPKGWHEGNPGGLAAVDTDLTPGNIKVAVTIFGKLGTLAGGPPSTTELFFATEKEQAVGPGSGWVDFTNGGGTVPAAALKVEAWFGSYQWGVYDAPHRILYNDVEKAGGSRTQNKNQGCRWEGNGIGGDAILKFQGSKHAIENVSHRWTGGCWYQTV